jgi:two-component system, LytTR family, response regulator LytT
MKVLIIEDESLAARRLQYMLTELSSSVEVVGLADGVESALLWLNQQGMPDLIFMDIHLSDGHAFDIFSRIEIPCPVIFCTAYDQYAIQAFKHHTIDYLLKPVKAVELKLALDKFQRLYNHQLSAPNQPEPTKIKRFMIKSPGAIQIIDVNDIAFFFSQHKITYLITVSGKKFALDYTLDRLENILDYHFFRINRQYIIANGAIAAMAPGSKGRVLITLQPSDRVQTIVSAERANNFKHWLIKS